MKTTEFHRILIANRGEISLRIIRAIQQLDKLAVVVHSEEDNDLPFVTEADEAYSLGKGELNQTYLNMGKILEIAREAHVDAIHPGYGFLAENAEFAEACVKEGFSFIGPPANIIALMGHKTNARKVALKMGIPLLDALEADLDSLIEMKNELPYPVLIKPAAGGGGKGMRIVTSAETFEPEAREASREASNYFGSGELYVERFLKDPRHIEVQVVADHYGNMVHLFERECSLQRRYQKIIEEAPSDFITPETRERITSMSLEMAREIGYSSLGTIEFLMDRNQNFYFLEMNTRIQVEHPVTEKITGIDLVREQILISQGHPLSFTQQEVVMNGHSIETRIYAENPKNGFLPSTGRIKTLDAPVHPQIRIDTGFKEGNMVESWYDPMLAKVIVHGRNREDARNQLIGALKDIRITGLTTNRDFLIGLLRSDYFRENKIHTRLLDSELESLLSSIEDHQNKLDMDSLLAAATLIVLQNSEENSTETGSPWHRIGHWRILPQITIQSSHTPYQISYKLEKGRERMMLNFNNRDFFVELEKKEGRNYWIRVNRQLMKVWGITDRSEIRLDLDGHLLRFRRLDILDQRFIQSTEKKNNEGPGEVTAPLNGRIVQINVKKGDMVEEGDPLIAIESMKMENKILSLHKATIEHIEVSVGDQVQANQILLNLASI